nr:LysR family transcriptional regulator [uncultured Oscillibacter sp.]
MTDKEILYISTIAQCSSITKAAEKLFISQPSLTQALHRIEAEWGAELFLRGQGGLRLTEAGRIYLHAASQMADLYQQLQQEVSETSARMRGQMSLGITPFQGGILLPSFLSQYHKRFPEMKLSVVENTSAQLEQMILNGQIDLAVLHSPVTDYRLGYDTLYREDFYLAVPVFSKDHAAAEGEIPLITPRVLAKQKLVMLSSSQRIRQIADSICLTAGIKPKIQFTTSNFMTALGLTARGLGATFIPKSFARFFAGSYPVAYFRFPAEWNAGWTLMVAYPRNTLLPKASMELIRVMRECIASMPEVFS